MIGELLSQAGLKCESAHDGQAGLELILKLRPDAAVIDVGLPSLDGFEVAQRVRQEPNCETFLIALTGYGRATDRERALESGFDEHIVKPVDPELLVRLLGRHRSHVSVDGAPGALRPV